MIKLQESARKGRGEWRAGMLHDRGKARMIENWDTEECGDGDGSDNFGQWWVLTQKVS